jgi:iron(III) transport system substrate-binding protein
VGVTKRVTVMAYNTGSLTPAELPTSVLALADPKWKGKIALAPSETDFQPVVTSVYNTVGKAATLRWLEGLKANAGSHIYPDNESMLAAINGGQVELGVIEQYYWYRLQAEIGKAAIHSAIAPFAEGDPGYLSGISGAGVLKSSHEQAAAQQFVAFLVSKQGQAIIAHSDSFEYPLVAGAPTPNGEPPFSSYHPTPLDIKELGTGATALALLKEAQLL